MKTPAGENPGSCGILCRSVSLGEQPLCVQEDVGNVSLSSILFFREGLQGCTGYKKTVGMVISLSQEPAWLTLGSNGALQLNIHHIHRGNK